ncbi:cytochrome P450 [Plectonema cf. radiosum LEGE 06105]|uniref:Cytochrome P450 n=1 Tax=Plectonema cf. radiosum LEGE 06105 TaxID=945769 RepID=A0A8J7JU48_9CYAN|nr:cytochrome P450 [Plectonema radiosum]MBE9214619.1 cytochrome P450 [Plectonema cf. radiosum LEGE 06105]
MKLPNGPQTPSFIQTFQFILNPLSMMENCARRYGDIFTLNLKSPVVFISNPQALQQILTNDTKDFSAPSKGNKAFEPLMGKHSVIMASGDRHRRQRQLLMPSFHGDRMRCYAETIDRVTSQIMNQWEVGQQFSVRDGMQAITMRVIMQAVFGIYSGDRATELEKLLGSILDAGGSTPLKAVFLIFPILQRDWGAKSYWGNFLRQRERIYQLLNDEIEERRASPDDSRTDVLSMLMAARDENGEAMTNVELRSELITLLFAGHETTATALAWALYWIHKFPEVREKLLTELDTLDENSDFSTINKLPYLNAVCNETLRIYPVGILLFQRQVETPVTLCGHDLEPGTLLYGSIYLTHQREDLYPEPKKFKPERFLERQFSPYEFIPFGGGARRCIGMAFAQFEMKLILTNILRNLELDLIDNGEIKPQRRGLVTGPNRPIQMVVKGKRTIKSRSLSVVN